MKGRELGGGADGIEEGGGLMKGKVRKGKGWPKAREEDKEGG
jgi:hypothetical protein